MIDFEEIFKCLVTNKNALTFGERERVRKNRKLETQRIDNFIFLNFHLFSEVKCIAIYSG